MKKILIFIFVAVFLASLGFTDVALCGLNANAKIKIKVLRESVLPTWTSSTAISDTLRVDRGQSLWVKIYAQNVTALQGWSVEIKLNTLFATLKASSQSDTANIHINPSAAGEKGILLKNDTTGRNYNYLPEPQVFDSTTGIITLSKTIISPDSTSRPILKNDTGFVAEFKLYALDAIWNGAQDIFRVTTVKLIDSSGVFDRFITTTGVDSATIYYLPVELSSYTGIIIGDNSVKLNWTTASETNNLGFEVQRSTDGIKFEKVKFIDGFGTTSEEHIYFFTDESLPAGTYYYRLAQTDFNGVVTYTDEIQVTISTPNEYSLSQNYPNPFNPKTTIKFALKETGLVELKVYNILGQLVETVINREMKAGNHTVDFDASRLSSGIYFYSIKTNNFSAVKKMVVMK